MSDTTVEDPAELRAQLEEMHQLLAAIREGDVDAVVPAGAPGQQLYTQVGADRPYRVIVEQMGDGALTVSPSGVVRYANERFAELLGVGRTSLLGRDVTGLVDPASAADLAELLRAVPGRTHRSELTLAAAGGTVPVLASVTGLDIDGDVVRCLIAVDLTDRRRAEQQLAGAYADLARSAVELEEAQRIGGIGNWQWDTTTDEVIWSAQMYRITGLSPAPGRLTVSRGGTAVHPEDMQLVPDAVARACTDHRPFTVEQRLLHPDGDIRHTVIRGEPILDPDGVVRHVRGTTQDVTEQRRSAAAVVQAREALVRRTMQLAMEHSVKQSLQRAVLPARLPTVPGVELAARYLPADEPAVVGGDWYDAFPLPGGTLAIAVGDVVGHDLDAAATMGRQRNALRAYAFDTDLDPAGTAVTAGSVAAPDAVLRRLNRLTTELDDHGLATVLFGHLDPGRRRLRWASAGHLPPLVLGSRTGVRFLPAVPGRMLGASPDGALRPAATQLDAGDLVLLYTDGLIERRDADLDAGFAALAEAAADLVGRSAEAVCDAVLERLLGERGHDDDVCLLAVRLLPAE